MTREQRIVETFVELDDTMVDDFDVIEFLHRLAERCVELVDCTEAGLLLTDAAGMLRVMASSSERSDALDLLQTQNDEGPCFECFHRAEPVSSVNLIAELGRWPTFGLAAVELFFVVVVVPGAGGVPLRRSHSPFRPPGGTGIGPPASPSAVMTGSLVRIPSSRPLSICIV